MAPTSPTTQEQTMPPAGSPQTASAQPQAGAVPTEMPGVSISNLDQNQIMSLLRNLPTVFTKLAEGHKDSDAAQTLSNLSQGASFPIQFQGHQVPQHQVQTHGQPLQHGLPMPTMSEPGPSSHPRGPPNLGQLSALAIQAQSMAAPRNGESGPREGEDGGDGDEGNQMNDQSGSPSGPTNSAGGRRGGRNSAAIGSDEWARQRKDNHKEVERRRRGNINEGINELGRIVPNGSGEKAKGAILSRAVQYIHHLKENEARNIEKWTLEKLLMDQAMGDLQSQLGEVQNQNVELQRVKGEMERQMGEMQGEIMALRKQVEDERKKREAAEKDSTDKVEIGTKRRSPDGEVAERDDAEKKQKTDS